MATFDERAKEWDTPDRIERAAVVNSCERKLSASARTIRAKSSM